MYMVHASTVLIFGRAEETRTLAENMTTNLHAYGVILRFADEYERLADMADRENARNRLRPCPRPRDRGHPPFCLRVTPS